MRRPLSAISLAAGWVMVSAACVLAGWGLTLAGKLGLAGYGGVAIGLLAGAWVVGWRSGWPWTWRLRWHRWRSGWPAAFAVLWTASTIGGLLYAPSNIDALTYRLPRVLHWLDAGRWHWIETGHLRMNYSAAGAEWLSVPWLAALESARPLFFFNAISLWLMPGLLFVWLRGLGAGAKAAWRWMWLTPAALGFALQAGSIANDLLGAGYFLAALALAQRAAATRRAGWFVLAVVALGLATGVKASNLALVPMGAVALWPAWRGLAGPRVRVALVALALGGAVSSGPTLLLNASHSGHWSGDPANQTQVRPGSAAAAVAGNAALTALQNLAPPFFPWAGAWNSWSEAALMPRWCEIFGPDGFPRLTLRLAELPQEEWAGLGLAFCGLLAVEAWLARGRRRRLPPTTRWTLWAGAGGALAFAAVMGSEMPARLLLPFSFGPIAAVAVAAPGEDFRKRGAWRIAAGATLAVALAAVAMTPARPLFPAQRFWRWLETTWPGSPVVARAARVYATYAARPDMLRALREELRTDELAVGFLASDDDSDWSLWSPRGARHVVHVANLADPRLAGLRVLVVRADVFWPRGAEEAALAAAGWRVVARHELVMKAAKPAERWLVARRER